MVVLVTYHNNFSIKLLFIFLEYKSAFAKFSRYRIDSLNVDYDYHSIMHYGKNAFSKNNLPTILPRREDITTLGNDRLSPLDIKQTWLLYKCDGGCDIKCLCLSYHTCVLTEVAICRCSSK